MKISGFDENSHDGLPRMPKPKTRRVGPVHEDGSFRVADGRVFDPDSRRLRRPRKFVSPNDLPAGTERS